MLEEANTALPRAYGHTEPSTKSVFIHYRRATSAEARRSVLSSGDSPGRIIGPVGRIIKALMLAPFVSQTMPAFVAKASSTDLQILKELIEAGSVTPVVDRTYSLSDTAEAIRYVESGHARGKVVIVVDTA